MTDALPLRSRAEAATANLAALLARAEQLAAAVMPGGHGRRRAGAGDDFWQYRPVQAGDTLRMVDWRRSAQSDAQFVRQKEWQISQSVFFWVDRARSMQFASGPHLPQKIDRAQLVSLAAGILLSRGGERIGLSGEDLPPRAGSKQLQRFAELLASQKTEDYAAPQVSAVTKNAFVIFVSDFWAILSPQRPLCGKLLGRVPGAFVCKFLTLLKRVSLLGAAQFLTRLAVLFAMKRCKQQT